MESNATQTLSVNIDVAGGAEAGKAISSLSDQLFQLRMNFGKLKAAVGDAAAPIVRAFIPAMNQAVQAATRFVKSAGAVIAALFGGTAGTEALADSAEAASSAEKTLTKTASTAGKAVKRSLAGFDELEVLTFGGSSGSVSAGVEEIALPTVTDTLTPKLQAMVDKIMALVAPLREIDFSPAVAAFGRLGEAIGGFGDLVAKGLEWAWFHILTPLAKWVIEQAVPASVDVLTAAFDALTAILEPIQAGLQSLLTALEPVFWFLAGAALTALQGVKALFEQLGQVFTERGAKIQGTLSTIGETFSALWSRLEPVLRTWLAVFSAGFSYLSGVVSTWAGLLIDILHGLAEFLAGVFAGDWSRAWARITSIFSAAKQAVAAQMENLKAFLSAAWPAIAAGASQAFGGLSSAVKSVFTGMIGVVKGAVNGVIGLINGLIRAVAGGINAVLQAVNGVHFDIPSWVPGLGGKSFGLNLSYVSVPQIPYLAQGAVLPANKPFLAMVGDQRNGTNVEAPLATIQEAVAAVLGEGQQAQVMLLRQILQAVLGIEVGDAVIGQAAERYRRKMAVVTGGAL